MIRIISVVLCVVVACGDPAERPPDAPSTIPRTAAGTFAVESTYDFALPEVARPALATFADATDSPDDPSRFVVDAMVAALPHGTIAHVAAGAAPFVAAYLNSKLAHFAPKLAPGLAAIAAQLGRIAQHLVTIESIQIGLDGELVRTVSGVRYSGTATGELAMPFAEVGLPQVAATANVEMRDGILAIPAHPLALPYGDILRAGLARAVIPSVDPGARDLATALRDLVDCAQVGDLVADKLGVGYPAMYETACDAAMLAIAARVDGELAAIGNTALHLDAAGTATGYDMDGDGTMDAIQNGAWTGQPESSFAVSAGRFTGVR